MLKTVTLKGTFWSFDAIEVSVFILEVRLDGGVVAQAVLVEPRLVVGGIRWTSATDSPSGTSSRSLRAS